MQPHDSLQQHPATGENRQGAGPGPHEDLTIAEHLETMYSGDEHRPREKCFLDESHEQLWVDEDQLARFLKEYGALHPSDYRSQHGTDWQDDLFQNLH
ncbi:MAG: hypothetical protein EOP87_04260 [Verrucomicrobiaceae bacterium]|nr:MAG: hypothetical protein EOP87_04260 [Verrucomicrobiaceae bacterium]